MTDLTQWNYAEGILGVVTEVIVKVRPAPECVKYGKTPPCPVLLAFKVNN